MTPGEDSSLPLPVPQWDDSNVICPYCRNAYQAEASSYTEEIVEETCDECGKTYLRWDDFSITHRTRPRYPDENSQDESKTTAHQPLN